MTVKQCYSCGKENIELFLHKGISVTSGKHFYCVECLTNRGIKVVSLKTNYKRI